MGLQPQVDLALLDVAMPRRTGLQAARERSARRPELRILMVSRHDAGDYVLEAVRAGASGYVLKTAADRDLLDACRAALRGETFLYPESVKELLGRAAIGDGAAGLLTAREEEVVKLVAEGMTTGEIAGALVISPRTVERHRENVLAKLGLRNRVQLTRYAIRHGLVEP